MKKKVLSAAVAILSLGSILGLNGCGGGGGTSSTTATQTSATTRQIQIGDRVVYAVSGNTRGPVSGTVTIVISEADGAISSKYGGKILKETTSSNLTVDNQPYIYTNTSYLEQTSDGTVYDREQDTTDNPSIMYPSPIHERDTWSYSWQYGISQRATNTYTVTGLEAVNGWMAYKIENVTSDEDGQSINYEWYVPDLGIPVRMTQKIQYTEGTYLDATLSIQSKNF